MARIHVVERAPLAVLTSTVDIRRGKTVDNSADAERLILAGEGIHDWWMHGDHPGEWCMNLIDRTTGEGTPLDLRFELLKGLCEGQRISTMRKWLELRPDGARHWQSFAHPEVAKHFHEIGRDVVAWYQDGLPSRTKTLLNAAWDNFRHRREMERARGTG